MNKLIDANLHFLRQAAELVDQLEDTCYARCEPAFYNSSIGAHLRHCLEHYEAFAAGMNSGRIDYDARQRDEAVENETGAAHKRIVTLAASLESLKEDEGNNHAAHELQIKMDCGEDREGEKSPSTAWQVSTIGRELQFLVSHTVHHFAMIRSLCVGNGTEVCSNFGVAPSTLKHRELIRQNTG